MLEVPSPASLTRLFVTEIYRTELGQTNIDALIVRLDEACRTIAAEHSEGKAWADKQGYLGYTSYGTIDDLWTYLPVFGELKRLLDIHALLYSRLMDMELGDKSLELQAMWINVLHPNGAHGGHIHPQSVISGTLYISVPQGASMIQFEDPRLGMMMHAPKRSEARQERQVFVPLVPVRGALLMWESWLRHEVPTNRSDETRISISFNYDLVPPRA